MFSDTLQQLFDQVFDLPVDWSYTQESREIPLEVLKEFSRLSGEIAKLTNDSQYHSAISFLWKARRFVGIEAYNSSNFIGTEVSAADCERIMQFLQSDPKSALNVIAKSARNGPLLSTLLLSQGREDIFEVFLEKERLILRRWGLNQQSVEIIIDRLRWFEFKIFFNLTAGGSISSDRLAQMSVVLGKQSNVPNAAYDHGQRGKNARSSLRANLVLAKDKIIGAATLFGDASPIVLGFGLDVSSFISTACGATVMAILPRGKPSAPKGDWRVRG